MEACRLLCVAFSRGASELDTSRLCIVDRWEHLQSFDAKKGSISDDEFQLILHDEDLTL